MTTPKTSRMEQMRVPKSLWHIVSNFSPRLSVWLRRHGYAKKHALKLERIYLKADLFGARDAAHTLVWADMLDHDYVTDAYQLIQLWEMLQGINKRDIPPLK